MFLDLTLIIIPNNQAHIIIFLFFFSLWLYKHYVHFTLIFHSSMFSFYALHFYLFYFVFYFIYFLFFVIYIFIFVFIYGDILIQVAFHFFSSKVKQIYKNRYFSFQNLYIFRFDGLQCLQLVFTMFYQTKLSPTVITRMEKDVTGTKLL